MTYAVETRADTCITNRLVRTSQMRKLRMVDGGEGEEEEEEEQEEEEEEEEDLSYYNTYLIREIEI